MSDGFSGEGENLGNNIDNGISETGVLEESSLSDISKNIYNLGILHTLDGEDNNSDSLIVKLPIFTVSEIRNIKFLLDSLKTNNPEIQLRAIIELGEKFKLGNVPYLNVQDISIFLHSGYRHIMGEIEDYENRHTFLKTQEDDEITKELLEKLINIRRYLGLHFFKLQ